MNITHGSTFFRVKGTLVKLITILEIEYYPSISIDGTQVRGYGRQNSKMALKILTPLGTYPAQSLPFECGQGL